MRKYFKFRTCNFQNLETLENYKIFACKLERFNDPFEGVVWEDNDADIVTQMSNAECKKELKMSINNRSFYCISASEDTQFLTENVQMWSHYADEHKGFCIEYNKHIFDNLERDKSENSYIKVEYNNSLPELRPDWVSMSRDERIISIIGRKSEGWSSEQEIRLIFRGEGLKSIPRKSIVAIYMGAKIAEYNEIILRYIANKMKIPCFKMVEHKQYYKLEIKQDYTPTSDLNEIKKILSPKVWNTLVCKYNVLCPVLIKIPSEDIEEWSERGDTDRIMMKCKNALVSDQRNISKISHICINTQNMESGKQGLYMYVVFFFER